MKLWDVIEFLNENNVLIQKHECEDFNTNSKLIVREGQVAVFIKNGEVLDTFQPGRYTLKTENIPLLSKLIRKVTTDGINSYSAELYFIDTTDQLSLKWGTRNPLEIRDPLYSVIIKVGANGEATFQILDAVKLIRKIVGVKGVLSNEQLIEYFRGIINTYIKNLISDALVINKISILDINSTLVTISKNCNEEINKIVSEYGIFVKNLVLETVRIDENDPSFIKLKQILEKKTEMELLGYSYQEERSFNTMDSVAKNSSSAGIANSLMGIGLGFGLAKPVGNAMGNLAENVSKQIPAGESKKEEVIKCPYCGTNLSSSSKFCPNCGQKIEIKKSFCPNCGIELSGNSNFCPNCGEKLK